MNADTSGASVSKDGSSLVSLTFLYIHTCQTALSKDAWSMAEMLWRSVHEYLLSYLSIVYMFTTVVINFGGLILPLLVLLYKIVYVVYL